MNIDDFQMGFSPGLGSIGAPTEATLYMPRSIGGTKTKVQIASIAEDGLYRVEIAIPWSIFDLTHPYLGMYSGFTLCVNDNDDPTVNAQQTHDVLQRVPQVDEPDHLGAGVVRAVRLFDENIPGRRKMPRFYC